ncbi:NAD-dependent epimerase/dehydratase family protein [Mangrovibrevibacter kandeliae]|uniref:NAD-dependent epimerase/dehydratase family protein n=1 Tax=Mangrovibrevibacter kandeliae TaxID=2968473 RepID=UPI0021185458|nr:NAD(P)-dependent oxidoreductase [Aurantimonas sp. CSK15Z-1]MCQ8782897.1 NAD(P)-dependent oxidoreductase [Aurantimonas sp. CSK15Z-1]
MSGRATRSLGRVLLTGARGFLGGATRARLRQEGIDVVGADIGDGMPGDGITACDLRCNDDIVALFASAPFDTVLHCGAVSGPMVLADRPGDIWRINAQGTAELLEAARRSGAGRIVVCSSVEVYGARRRGVLDESAPPDPPGVYGASKLAAEAAVIGYANGEGLDVLALRLGWVYGPGRATPTMLEALLRAATEGRDFEVEGHPADVAHYLYIEDAVSGLLAAATAGAVTSRIFNIVGPAGETLGDVADVVGRLCPQSRIDFERAEPSAEGPDGYTSHRAADELGFRAHVRLGDGLERTMRSLATPPA